jgi:predicted N-acetyltransferase YhbS
MEFRLSIAQPRDASRITQIHMDAFGSNAIIRAIHAADPELEELRRAVEDKILADTQDEKITVLVVRADTPPGDKVEGAKRVVAAGDIIAFAKWTHPIHPGEHYTPPSWNLPKSTNQNILGPWRKEVERVEAKIIGDTPRYGQSLGPKTTPIGVWNWKANMSISLELTYLAVESAYARSGIGRMLVQWALDRCDTEQRPAYVESTVDAVGFYEKMGFVVKGRINLDLGVLTGGTAIEVYEEVGCIYQPRQR